MNHESTAEQVLDIFDKGKELTRSLLDQNQRLRFQVAALQTAHTRFPAEVERLEQAVCALGDENRKILQRSRDVEEENKEITDRYLEIEQQNSNLANLYVASHQLHSTLDFREVVKIVQEIVINLVGAEVFSILLHDDEENNFKTIVSEGVYRMPGVDAITVRPGEGILGTAAKTGEAYYDSSTDGEVTLQKPLAVVPLKIKDRTIGLIVIYKLLQHKDSFSAVDYELFTLLAAHAATAIFASKLYWQSERKLNTIKSFLDLLTTG